MNNMRMMSYELRITNGEWRNRHVNKCIVVVASLLLALLLTACGGGPPAQPTAIPASVAKPEQPSPDLVRGKPVFRAPEASATVIIVPDADVNVSSQFVDPETGSSPSAQLSFELPPSALGIATSGTSIVDKPGGNVMATVPGGNILTVTGRSSDKKFLAVYNDAGISGWVPVNSLKLFGADDLTVVEFAISPAPIATFLAELMIPLETSALDAAMAAMTETAPITVSTPTP